VRAGTTWTQSGPKIAVAGDSGCYRACFGASVALSADAQTALVSYPDALGVGVFARDGGTWHLDGAFHGQFLNQTLGGVTMNDAEFGEDIALSASGDTALVMGSPSLGPSFAYIFDRVHGTWTFSRQRLGSKSEENSTADGQTVAISADGHTALITGDYINGDYAEAAWAFTLTHGRWKPFGLRLPASNATGSKLQVMNVALSGNGDEALIGGNTRDGLLGSGRAWIYRR